MKKCIADILNDANKIENEEQRAEFIRNNYSLAMETVFRGIFDESIVWDLPLGAPPYKENNLPDSESVFYTECRRLYIFVKGGADNVSRLRKETLFIELLEMLHPNDAKLLLCMKDKINPYENINVYFLRKYFPNLRGVLTKDS
jgi:hypothetical protein